MRDRLHQDVRLALVPEVRATFDRLREAGLAVCVSGSGRRCSRSSAMMS
jgi:homoserine kinase